MFGHLKSKRNPNKSVALLVSHGRTVNKELEYPINLSALGLEEERRRKQKVY